MKNIFTKAKETSKNKICPGCNKKKPIGEFIKNKNCNDCPKTELCRTMYYNGEKIMEKEEAIEVIKAKGYYL